MHIFIIIVAIIIGYIIGSFPTAYLVARVRKGVDIREVGSRNMGTMNTLYKVGIAEGLLVLFVDLCKGALGVGVAHWLGTGLVPQMLAGSAVVLGHAYPVFLKFRGGIGGACAIGVCITFMPWGVPIYLAIFLIILGITRFPTLSYSLAFICFPFVAWLINHSWQLVVFACLLPILPLLKYIPRILEMRRKGGSWKHVFVRRNLKDRL